MREAVRLAFAVLGVLAGSAAAGAQQADSLVEAVTARALLERGSFVSCAMRQNKTVEAAELKRVWQIDMRDLQKELREIGYSADYVNALPARFNIDIAVPKFSDPAEWGKFCVMVGDWEVRTALFLYTSPQLELRSKLRK